MCIIIVTYRLLVSLSKIRLLLRLCVCVCVCVCVIMTHKHTILRVHTLYSMHGYKAANLLGGKKLRVKLLVIVYVPSVPGGYKPTTCNEKTLPFSGLGECNCSEKLYGLSKVSFNNCVMFPNVDVQSPGSSQL